MTMIRFTYDDGERSGTATWSPEYGWMMAGDKTILDHIEVQEIEPRVVDVPVLSVPMRVDVPTAAGTDPYDDPEPTGVPPAEQKRCFACDHLWHTGVCQVSIAPNVPCDCAKAVA